MTRFKKELKRKGFKFEEDYDFLPFPSGGSGVMIDMVLVNAEEATWKEYYNVIAIQYTLNRDGTITETV